MGTIFTKVRTRKVERREVQVHQDFFVVPTILRQILQKLSNEELIKFSLVNKLWNFEARSVIKERGTVIANLSQFKGDDECDPCQKLIAFASDVTKMRVVPFSGIYIDMHHLCTCQSISTGSLAPSYEVILNCLQWKYFAVNFCEECEQCKNCSAIMLVKEIFMRLCGVAEELSLPYGREEFYQIIFQDRLFPRLKMLKVEPGDFATTTEPLKEALLKTLVSRAPHLQELHIVGDIYLEENVLQGSSAMLVPTRPFCPLVEHVCDDLIRSLKVNSMELFVTEQQTDPDLLIRFIPMVLAAIRTTLTTLNIDLISLEYLLYYGICLENVTSLHVHEKVDDDRTKWTATVLYPDGPEFSRVFPKLKHCKASYYYKQECKYIFLTYSPALVP